MDIISPLLEVFTIINRNKLRNLFTGLAIAWGIFLLIILFSAGNGLKYSVYSDFSERANNSITIWGGTTSISYNGFPINREISFDRRDFEFLQTGIEGINYISMSINRAVKISFREEYKECNLEGVYPDFIKINRIMFPSDGGRFINTIDINSCRKVVVINTDLQNTIFNGVSPIGEYLNIDNLYYKIIGVYENEFDSSPAIYIPFTTAQLIYFKGTGIKRLDFTVNGILTVEQNEQFVESIREKIGQFHNFRQDDLSAIRIWNTIEEVQETKSIFNTIEIFIWIVGICSLISGIVGVGNIMIISVRERTQEIGIRKAIGASSYSILILVVIEAIVITLLSGLFGIFSGICFIKLSKKIANSVLLDNSAVLLHSSIDTSTLIIIFVIIFFSGIIAGLLPAIRATQITPLKAINND